MAVHTSDQSAPARSWQAVTPSDVTGLPAGCRGIYIGGDGDVSLLGAGGTSVTFVGLTAGTFMPCGPVRVNAAGTTATNIVALY